MIEAMKQALEALEANQPINFCQNNNGDKFPMFSDNPLRFEKNNEAITSIRQAIADLEKQEPVAWQQAMERAFWRMYDHGKDNNPVSAQCEIQALRLLCDGTFDDITAWHPSQWKLPQRQPLTDEMVRQCKLACDTHEMRGAFVDGWTSAEAAHGIKENT